MALTLYVDTARWRAHQQVRGATSSRASSRSARATATASATSGSPTRRPGSAADMLAVGTTYEAARIKDWFGGDLLVLTPFRRGEEPVPLPDRVIRSVSSVGRACDGLVGARVVIEVHEHRCGGTASPRRTAAAARRDRGRAPGGLRPPPAAGPHGRLRRGRRGHRLDGPAARRPGCRCTPCSSATCAAAELAALQQQFPQTRFRPRIGTRLWLGDHEATEYRGAVLDVTRVAKGERFGYRQQRAPRPTAGWWSSRAAPRTASAWRPPRRARRRAAGQGRRARRAGHGQPRTVAVRVGGQAALVRRAAAHAGVDPVRCPWTSRAPAVGDELVAHLRTPRRLRPGRRERLNGSPWHVTPRLSDDSASV